MTGKVPMNYEHGGEDMPVSSSTGPRGFQRVRPNPVVAGHGASPLPEMKNRGLGILELNDADGPGKTRGMTKKLMAEAEDSPAQCTIQPFACYDFLDSPQRLCRMVWHFCLALGTSFCHLIFGICHRPTFL